MTTVIHYQIGKISVCKYCKKSGLRWILLEQGWRLHENNEPHICKEYEEIEVEKIITHYRKVREERRAKIGSKLNRSILVRYRLLRKINHSKIGIGF